MSFVPGVKSTFDNNGSTSLPEIADGLKFLNPKNDGIKILKMLGLDGFTFRNHKHEWRETVLAARKETITIDSSATSLAVADAYQYLPDTILRSEAEIMRVTAIADATHLTVVRGYAGTSAAAHSSKSIQTLGTAKPEGADAGGGVADNGSPLYNYDQIFERGVSLTNHEIAALSVEGNPLPKQISRRQIELYREIASAMFNGVRYQDSSNEIYLMGGLKQFVQTNVTNVGGAISNAVIDAQILAIVQAGGDPKTISCSPYQAQKIAALDANLQQIGKKEHTAGNLVTKTYQSTLLDHDLDIIIDHTILDSEVHINDWDFVKLGHLSGNGVSGAMHLVDATKPGANRKEQTLRADISMKVELEKAQGYLYGLS
jgi:hypothetical protein